MTLADHLRPLLRDHDCVIIPDFGGLVAEYAPARVQPAGRHLLSPPTRQVAFNQALSRNDGLLLDALRQHLGVSAAEAREYLRQAVAALHQELQAQHRTELPGIGVFRQQAGRGLQFEYTGTENLLATAFGLPELTAHPLAVIDARLAREQQAQLVPRLRSAARRTGRPQLRQLVRGGAIGLAAGVVAAAVYLLSLHPTAVPVAWQGYLPRWEKVAAPVAQQAALVRPSLGAASVVTPVVAAAPATVAAPAAPKVAAVPAAVVVPAEQKAVAAPAEKAAVTVLAAPKAIAKPVVAPKAHVIAVVVPAASKAVVVKIQDSKKVAVAPAVPATKAPAAAASVAFPTSPAASTINARTGRFYIMVAAYSSLARAEEGRRNLAHAGRPAKVILPFPGTHFYRLTAADFATRPEALAAAARLRQNPHLDKGLSVFPY